MKNNAYNDLLVIINNVKSSLYQLLPEKYVEFVKSCAAPDGQSDIRRDVPLEEQKLSEETRNHLAALYLTYWSEGPLCRREFAEKLYKNELAYGGKESRSMTEEEYQAFLEPFDDWNEMFGLIPYGAQSRGWQPEHCYQIASKDENAELVAGDFNLKEVYITPEQRNVILKEAQQWVLVKEIKESETLYWHNDDHSEWTRSEETEDFYKNMVVIKDGHFFGALLDTIHHWGMGMASYRNNEYGILCIDGSQAGRTDEYEGRSSDESSYDKKTTYSLKRKQQQ